MKSILIHNNKLDSKMLSQIISLKQQYWEYSYTSQVEWMRKNLQGHDNHLLLYDDSLLVGYLNLVNLKVTIDNKVIDMIGIGNVCVDRGKQGQGYGTRIVQGANQIIMQTKRIGLLLCHLPLVSFYHKCGWREILDTKVTVGGKLYKNNIMFVNGELSNIKHLTIDRNF